MTYRSRGRRSAYVTSLALGAMLAVPATSVADPSESYKQAPHSSIQLTGVKVKKFNFSGSSSVSPGRKGTNYSNFSLERGKASSFESHSRGDRVGSVKLAKSLASGTWKTSLKKAFTVKMRFKATKPARKVKPFKGCKGGQTVTRVGVVTGSLKVNMGKYFKTIKLSRASALATHTPELSCKYSGGSGSPDESASLFTSGNVGGGFSAYRRRGLPHSRSS